MTAPAEVIAQPYAAACQAYAAAGWPCVIPVPPDRKYPPPGGYTGAGGRDTAPEDIAGWAQARGGYSVALRMPDGVIGIDVDDYVKGEVTKHGAATVAAAEAELGPLPPTFSSTARGPGQPSRILFYRVPPGRYAAQLGPDVEIIQRHHRYAVVAPSPHSGTGTVYAWYGPGGTPLDGKIPGPGDLPELPAAWAAKLAEGAAAAGPGLSGWDEGMALLSACVIAGEAPCVAVAGTLAAWTQDCTAAETGSRHDAMTRAVYELVMLGTEGHPGSGNALAALQELWAQVTAGEGREDEFSGPSGFLVTAARKAAAKYPAGKAEADPCLTVFARDDPSALRYGAPAPGAPPGTPDSEIPRPVEPPRTWSPFGAIGTQPFTPLGGLDAPLARDVLARMWPVLRYAPDAGAWITRGPDKWEVRKGDLAKWAVDLVSWMMLRGDLRAPEGTEEFRLGKLHARFTTNASSNGIAGKMNAQVLAGHHPSAADLASLDSGREILWAGGKAYDLRDSADGPAISAGTDPGTPHLHSAGVVPAAGETPLWDNFTAAVWPDADLRAWALRVLSIAVTGYSDKALPILLGASDGGKTSIIVLLMSVLGSYAHVADARLLSPADRSHASIVYALKGRRLSFIDEAPRTGQLATERLKQITGGAELTGNRMNENPVTFAPTHTLVLTANPEHEPHLNDAAIRRRVRLIPCDGDPAAVRAARAAIGAENSPAWRAEAPAVLAGMMAEAARWLADPMSADNAAAPESGRAAVEGIRLSQDLVLQWVTEECEPWEQGTKSRELYMAFTDSCRRMAIHPSGIPSETAWGLRLNECEYPARHTRDGNVRQLRIRPPQGFTLSAAELSGATGGAAGNREGSTLHRTPDFQTPHKPSTNGNSAGQTIHSSPDVKGVKGSSLSLTHTHTRTHTHMQGGKGDPSLPITPSQPPGAGRTGQDGTPPEAKSPKVTRARQPKAPKREGPDPELAGPVLSLPAVVLRDGRVLPCTLEQAAAIAAKPELTVDVETTGYPVGHPDYALRTVQLGDEQLAVVLDAADPASRAVITAALAGARVLHAHSAAADLVPLAHAGLCGEDAWDRMFDTVLPAKLADPSMSGSDADGLKALAADVLRDYAVIPAANEARRKLFASGKWLTETAALTPVTRSGWAQVDSRCETMIRYAASDVLDTAALPRVLPQPDPVILGRERAVQAMCARVSHRGLRLDHAHIRELIAEHEAGKAEAAARCGAAGIGNPGSAQQVGRALADLGVLLPCTKPSVKFPQGQPSAAEAVLTPLGKAGGPAGQLAADVLAYREHATVLGLTLEPFAVLCERGDSRVRPVIYTLGTDTGRMCLPDDHGLVTQDGFAKPDEIRPGMLTMDANGNWVRVQAVHRYQDQPVITLAARGLELAATQEHRWVTTLDHRPGNPRQLRAVDDRPQLRIHLAPEAEPFDFTSRAIPAETDGQRFAALIGMLITDGRCAEGEPGAEVGLRSHVYQSERKFLAEFLRVIPDDALMYDRIKTGDHHELRIRSRWLRSRLDAAGLVPGVLLRESASLHRWAATLPDDELRAFFAACWLADGGFAGADRLMGNHHMSCSSANLRGVLTLAAYRLGVIAHEVAAKPSEWSVKPRYSLMFRRPILMTRRAARGSTRSDVWCVTTETGTFTAVSPQGTVYLTGNSCVRPNLQQLKRTGGLRACVTADDGMTLISADFQAVELRTAAALAGDADLYRMILAGDDLHWKIARQVWGADATKADRYNAKRGVFGRLYGAGYARLATTLGISEAEARAVGDTLDALAPGVARWSAGLQQYVRAGGTSFTAYSGRVIWLDRQHPHKGANFCIQGSAREFLADGLLRWRQTPWGDATIVPVHDEVLALVPAAEAEAATRALVDCMSTQLNGMPIVAEASEPSFAWADAS